MPVGSALGKTRNVTTTLTAVIALMNRDAVSMKFKYKTTIILIQFISYHACRIQMIEVSFILVEIKINSLRCCYSGIEVRE